MSDQSLREALEKLIQKYRGWTSHQAIADKLERILAAHPAEPAPVPDLAAALRATVDEAKARRLGVESQMLNREAVFRLLHEQGCGCDLAAEPRTVEYQHWLPGHRAQYETRADAVLALAVPVPTREQIAEAIHTSRCPLSWRECGGSHHDDCRMAADAVLALLNGSAK